MSSIQLLKKLQIGEHVVASVVLVLLVVQFGLAADQGGFFRPQSTWIFGASLLLIGVATMRASSKVMSFTIPYVALGVLWWLSVTSVNQRMDFLPLGASVTALGATYAGTSVLSEHQRLWLWRALSTVFSLVVVVGVLAMGVRSTQWAFEGVSQWRLALPGDYPNVAGVLAGAVGLFAATRAEGDYDTLVTAMATLALLATQSRAAWIGTAIAVLLLRRGRLRADRSVSFGLLGGLLGGLVCIAWSRRPSVVSSLAAVAVTVVPLLIIRHRSKASPRLSLPTRWVSAIVLCGVAMALPMLVRRVDLGSDRGHLRAWHGALVEFFHHPLLGVGFDAPISIGGGRFVYFAHNEYLQVMAATGAIGVMCLLGALWRMRRALISSVTARSLAVVPLVSGAFDYTWHVPVVGVMFGCLFALAMRSEAHGEPGVTLSE